MCRSKAFLKKKRGYALALLFAVFIGNNFISLSSNADEIDHALLKILYTYKFGKFTKWPEQKLNPDSDTFQVCILGQNPFSQDQLNLINTKTVQGLMVSISVFASGLVPEEVLTSCHIVYISNSEKYRLETILSSTKKHPILTVSDIPDFSSKGGMITLLDEQNKVRFQVNPNALSQADLSLSSKIMELAEIIIGGNE